MEITKIIKSENGQTLISPKDGFILIGSIFVSQVDENGMPQGGLFGDGKTTETILDAGVKPRAYSLREFIKGLAIDPYELKRIAEEMMLHARTL